MSALRKILIIFSLLIILLAGTTFFLWKNLDSIVQTAIEKYGSKASKTAVSVSSVRIKLSSGEGIIKGLAIGNPSGFTPDKAFSLDNVTVRINTGTVTSDIIVMDKILISAPQVLYEIDVSGASNINVLKKNIRQSTREKEKKTSDEKKAGKEKKFLVRKLIIENGKINLAVTAFGAKTQIIQLPKIVRTNIGKNNGATSSQIAEEIMTALVEEVARAVAISGTDILGFRIKGLLGK
jgi:hypothetical protein